MSKLFFPKIYSAFISEIIPPSLAFQNSRVSLMVLSRLKVIITRSNYYAQVCCSKHFYKGISFELDEDPLQSHDVKSPLHLIPITKSNSYKPRGCGSKTSLCRFRFQSFNLRKQCGNQLVSLGFLCTFWFHF